MKIATMDTLHEQQLIQAAQMLTDELSLGWPTLAAALGEVQELLHSDADGHMKNQLLAALDGESVIGWGGILPSYSGRVFELHPLVVCRGKQRSGVGTTLIRALEDAARAQGGLTIYLGADDEKPEGETSLAGVDLYDDLPRQIHAFQPGTHVTAFYLKMGYRVIGVMPDANGVGKPDIFLAKRLL